MRGKSASVMLAAALSYAAALHGAVYVTPDGTGDGSSWATAASLTSAVARVTQGGEIWLKVGTYLPQTQVVASVAFTLRGGFAGTESSAAERTFEAGESIIDGEKTYPEKTALAKPLALLHITAGSGEVVVERLTITHSYGQGLRVDGGAAVTLDTCRFIDNGYFETGSYSNVAYMKGLGAYVTGSASAKLVISDCAFEGNVLGSRTGSGKDLGAGSCNGVGLYAETFEKITMSDTSFVTNGLPLLSSARTGRDNTRGYAFYAKNAPVAATRVSFIGNGSVVHGPNCGGIAFLEGDCGGSSFSQCLFLANFGRWWGAASKHGGALVAKLTDNDQTVTIDGCTFAYNIHGPSGTTDNIGAAGLMVAVGAVTCSNSIFYGNVIGSRGAGNIAADAYCGPGASLAMDNCFLTDADNSHYVRNNGGTLSVTNVRDADPLLVTTKDEIYGLLRFNNGYTDGSFSWPCASGAPSFVWGTDLTQFDAHLRSAEGRWNGSQWVVDEEHSPAIDAAVGVEPGDEPEPNGGIANCGAYGRTAEASKTPQGMPGFDDLAVAQKSDDYTQPHISFVMAGSGVYTATVTLYWGLEKGSDDGSGWEREIQLSTAAMSADAFTSSFRNYFNPGEKVYWLLRAVAAYGTSVVDGSIDITGELPPWHGRKGPANVIHVRDGATGDDDGSSWSDAVSLDEALKLVSETKNEIWLASSVSNAQDIVNVPVKSLTIVGGFTQAYETNTADLAEGALSTIDGMDLFSCLKVAPAAGNEVVVRGVRFTRSYKQALYKTGEGDLRVENCLFENCGTLKDNTHSGSCPGRGVYASGSAETSALLVTNCVFRDNVMRAGANGNYNPSQSGCGVWVSGAKSATIVDSHFATNGIPLGTATPHGRDNTHGAALYVYNAPATVERCSFVGNGCPVNNMNATDGGGAVWVGGASDGTVFKNCAFLANYSRRYQSPAPHRWGGGAVMIELADASYEIGFDNCTFAYNFADGAGDVVKYYSSIPATNCNAGAIQIRKGAMTVDNTIFWRNFITTNVTFGAADIHVCENASATVRYSLFAADSSDYFVADEGGTLAVEDSCVFGAPLLVSDWDDAYPLINGAAEEFSPFRPTSKYLALTGSPAGLDVHVLKRSITIDAGDPDSRYRLEPSPNGQRVNIGAYGNTPEAALSPGGMVIIIR